MREAYILDAVRTAMGKNGGQLSGVRGDQLLAECLKALVDRTNILPGDVEDVVGGCVTQIQEQGVNVIRQGVLAAGWPISVPGTSVNRLCGSGQQAVTFAAMEIQSGQADLTVGCGMENMSRTPMGSDIGSFNKNITDRFELVQQGISAELMAQKYEISREQVDLFSYESHRKACHAIVEGFFSREIIAVGDAVKDEGPRFNADLEKMKSLRPAFSDDGVISAGASSQITDGASALLLGSAAAADKYGLKKRARIVATAQVGVDPTLMLEGPIPATRKVLEKAGLELEQIDLFEVNEAFASVVLAWQKELKADSSKVNVNGGAIALGHPLGATGARLITSILCELERRQKRYGLVTMCIGFGLGTATIIERLD
jgi:acetyl-CoA acyltransferase